MGHQNLNPKKGKKGEQKNERKNLLVPTKSNQKKLLCLFIQKIQNNVLFSKYMYYKYNGLMMKHRIRVAYSFGVIRIQAKHINIVC